MVEVIGVNLNNTLEKGIFDRFMSYASAEKRERIREFYRYEDALRTLIGDILIRYMLCRRLKIKNQKLIFGANEYNKPFLINCRNIQYNISHSGKWVICSIDNYPVGIDIEQIKPIDMSIAKRFFSKEEVKSLMSKCVAEREAYFYDLWALKESYIKAVGKGLSIPLDSFTIQIVDGNIILYAANESDYYYFKQYYIDKDYKMAVCSKRNEFPCNINFITVNELYEEIFLL